ncbi:hypothetical protein NQ317_011836 [Molorchus minor]|uniref:Uncharacterized protein n=1 Tax=Molorchus minor TaxID=1323400 RepID=A0ABQ9J7T5_9CUCU|nr:hypothetical protein NQ317_011836 [Molorchus minor]
MEQKKKHRKVLRTTFTKSAKELDELLSTPEGELRLIKVSLDILRQKIEDLKQVDSEIYNLLLDDDASEGDLLAEMEASDSYIKKFTDLNSRCEGRMQPKWTDAVENEVASVISNGTVNSRSGRRKLKLPTLEFKKFDGNIKEWLPFWSQFQKVHEDPDIDLNDKVEYLIQAMVPGSRARQLVDSFPATESNYSKMIDCLLSRFGREDLQIEVYVRELLKLVINNTTPGNKIDLSFLYDKLESQLRALETLGITSDKYAAMLFPLVESCLPTFVEESSRVMAEGKFDLRGWEHTHQVQDGNLDISTPVLGMKWDKENDTLGLKENNDTTEQFENKPVTRRMMLSQAQRIQIMNSTLP